MQLINQSAGTLNDFNDISEDSLVGTGSHIEGSNNKESCIKSVVMPYMSDKRYNCIITARKITKKNSTCKRILEFTLVKKVL